MKKKVLLISGLGLWLTMLSATAQVISAPEQPEEPYVQDTLVIRRDTNIVVDSTYIYALEGIVIKAAVAEMTVKGDTLEYNAAAFQTKENDMVEDLLKKMNGVEISADGKVTINGEEVKGVRIDGKKFFGNDVQMATKNIPASMIRSVQVIDEKSDMAKLTGFEDDETERIINLTLKPDRKKGIFGNFNGGIGADISPAVRYNAGLFMNLMLGESQTTIIGGANNTNEMRSGRGRGGWGSVNNGITRTENLGVNTNIATGTGLVIGGDASFNHSNNLTLSESRRQQDIFGEEGEHVRYHNNDSSSSMNNGWDATLRLEMEYEIDSLNKIIIAPNISYQQSNSLQRNTFLYMRAQEDRLDTTSWGEQVNESESHDINGGLRFTYNRKFVKPGRTITLTTNFSLNNTESNGLNMATGTKPLQQNQIKSGLSYNTEVKFSYVEPIYGRNHFLETALTFKNNYRSSDKRQYTVDSEGLYTVLDSAYSNSFVNNFFSEILEFNYKFLKEKFDLTAGMRINPSQQISQTHYLMGGGLDTIHNVLNWAPQVNFRYKLGKKQFIRFVYRGNTQQPSISQMEPVRDNSQTMSESVGNLDLNPAFQHSIRGIFSKYNADRMSSITVMLNGSLTKDALVSNRIYDQTGKVYQQTVNAQGIPYNVRANIMYNTPFAKKKMQFGTRTSLSYNERLSYMLREQDAATIDINHLPLGAESRSGNLRASEDLSLRYTHDLVQVGVRGNISYSLTNSSMAMSNTNHTIDWGVTGDFIFTLPKEWTISTDIGYKDRWGYGLDGNLSEIMWNASIEKSWNDATLAIVAKDILNQRKNIVETIGDNSIQYQKMNTLPTYVMVTFTYRLNKMGDLQAKGHAGRMQEMIETAPRGGNNGMPPAGPPPFMR